MIEYYIRNGGPYSRSSLLSKLDTTNDGRLYCLFVNSDGYNFFDYSLVAPTTLELDCLRNKVDRNTRTSKWEI